MIVIMNDCAIFFIFKRRDRMRSANQICAAEEGLIRVSENASKSSASSNHSKRDYNARKYKCHGHRMDNLLVKFYS